ncbi:MULTISPECIES: ABC transporter substrate-binding protein [unclassified Tolypothrix]|uniref:ABC transporter substrate-binding protein n=1 Tax=unclassified Tolypothrix TaxID=2649714 RepID=UPI0005EAAEFB|nr:MULTISPECIES: ABC transporter substrate-binding protein [unclassified Tolypothrix]BAY94832.1 extracellular ligand-binding receptor [Microchaete diplosiphon NIES-3275]EKE99269.1 ligand-binding protein, receptor family [Tolypothrix sp. PCC 7601]MBE9086318.1 ABC transporter substrate-binding protein [Tolypothrix sp. LEGE 11397]UYD29903.1 ABC transporter substrate-binding protein [Tolypothrix sp. PCC 7712]UYD37652.1 ABC transporter substrate-binding protein [Tolypothrix sp. PCC 7601]
MKNAIAQQTVLLFTCSVLLIGCGKSSSTDKTPATNSTSAAANGIPIGIAFAQTSNVALLGQEGTDGVKIAEKYFNAKGGINGNPIKLIFQDTGGDEVGTVNAFQTLINQNKVVGIIGPTLSQQAFSANPIAERNQIPVIGASNTAKGIPEIGDYVARVSSSVAVVAPYAVKAALKQNPNIKRVAIFYAQNDAFNKSETEIFQKTVKDLGLDLVTVQKFQTTDTDFQTQASSAINLKPDLAIISGLAVDGGNLVKQLRELGYQGIIIGGNGFNTSHIFSVCKALCDGVIIAQAYSPEYQSEINTAFRKAYFEQYRREPPQVSAQAFTALQVYVEALQSLDKKSKINQLSLPQLRKALNQELLKGTYQTPLGEIAFTPVGDVIQKDFYVAKLKMEPNGVKGKFAFLNVK